MKGVNFFARINRGLHGYCGVRPSLSHKPPSFGAERMWLVLVCPTSIATLLRVSPGRMKHLTDIQLSDAEFI